MSRLTFSRMGSSEVFNDITSIRIGYADRNDTQFPHSCNECDIDWEVTFIICTIVNVLGLEPEFVRAPTGEYGELFEMVERGEVDVAKALASYNDGGVNVWHSTPIRRMENFYIFGENVVLMQKPAAVLEVSLTMIVLGSFAVVYCAMSFIRLAKNIIRHKRASFVDIFWVTFAQFFTQQPSDSKLVIFTAFWIIVSLNAAFKTKAVIAIKPKMPFTSSKDLHERIKLGELELVFSNRDFMYQYLTINPDGKESFKDNPAKFLDPPGNQTHLKVSQRELCNEPKYIMYGWRGSFVGLPCYLYAIPTKNPADLKTLMFSKQATKFHNRFSIAIDMLFSVDAVEKLVLPRVAGNPFKKVIHKAPLVRESISLESVKGLFIGYFCCIAICIIGLCAKMIVFMR